MKHTDARTYAFFSSLVEELIGLRYEESARQILFEKLEVAAAEEGFDSLIDYYYFLRYDDGGVEARQRLIENLVVTETYFFREHPPLDWLVNDVLLPKVKAGGSARVWSAACSTGEEPLTLAMLLDEKDLLRSVEIVASDISAKSLARARSNRFRCRSLRDSAPERLVKRYLGRQADAITIDPRLIEHVKWKQINLLDRAAIAHLGQFDAILCRNVLIYFSHEGIAKVACSLSERLAPDGVLLVGVSETLFRITSSLVCEEKKGVFFYHRGRT